MNLNPLQKTKKYENRSRDALLPAVALPTLEPHLYADKRTKVEKGDVYKRKAEEYQA